MPKESNREDLDHTPSKAGNVGEKHKQANQKGEQPRHPEKPGAADQDKDSNPDKP